MKSGGQKLLWTGGVVKNQKVVDEQGWRQRLELCRHAKGTAVGRRLEDAIGIGG